MLLVTIMNIVVLRFYQVYIHCKDISIKIRAENTKSQQILVIKAGCVFIDIGKDCTSPSGHREKCMSLQTGLEKETLQTCIAYILLDI